MKIYKVDGEIINEDELILRIRSGKKDLFSYICTSYMPLINYYVSSLNCSEYDREDFLQVGLLALSGCVDLYDFSSSSFSTFVSICVKRAILSELRRLSVKKQIPASALVDIAECNLSDDIDPETSLIDKENIEALNKKIKGMLSVLEYKVLTSYLMFNSYIAVAKSLSISQKDVSNALQRARNKIKKSIGSYR